MDIPLLCRRSIDRFGANGLWFARCSQGWRRPRYHCRRLGMSRAGEGPNFNPRGANGHPRRINLWSQGEPRSLPRIRRNAADPTMQPMATIPTDGRKVWVKPKQGDKHTLFALPELDRSPYLGWWPDGNNENPAESCASQAPRAACLLITSANRVHPTQRDSESGAGQSRAREPS